MYLHSVQKNYSIATNPWTKSKIEGVHVSKSIEVVLILLTFLTVDFYKINFIKTHPI